MRKVILSLLFISATFLGSAQNDGIKFTENESWQQLLEKAGTQNKLIFLDCYTTWCGPCKGMAANVFTQKSVGDFMNGNFICTKRDMEKGEGVDLRTKYKQYIPGFPTFLVINSKGEVVHQAAGYMEPEAFIASMKAGLEQKSWLALKKRYETGDRDWNNVWEYFQALKAAYQNDLIKEVWKEAEPKLTIEIMTNNAGAYNLFKDQYRNVETPLFRAFMSTSQVYRKHKDTEANVAAWSGRLYNNTIRDYTSRLTNQNQEPKHETYNFENAAALLSDLRKFYMKDREKEIATMLINQAVYQQNWAEMFRLIGNAIDFGLIRTDMLAIKDWSRMCAVNTKNKKLLDKCLFYTDLSGIKENQLFPCDMNNRAAVLEKVGRTQEAQELRTKAKQKEQALMDQFTKATTK